MKRPKTTPKHQKVMLCFSWRETQLLIEALSLALHPFCPDELKPEFGSLGVNIMKQLRGEK